MDGDLITWVLLPGATAVLVAMLCTWLWTHDYEEVAAEMLSAIRDDDGKVDIGILWRRASGYMR